MTQYYVKNSGLNTNTGLGTTDSLAWRTINKATTTAVAGDVINIMAGTYTDNDAGAGIRTHRAGTAGNPITIQNYASGLAYVKHQPWGIYLSHSYITIDGILFINDTQSAGMIRGCEATSAGVTNAIIKNCTVRNTTGGDPSFGIDWQYVTDGKIQNCTIDRVGTAPQPGPESGNGVGIAGTRNLIENCTIDHCGHAGIFLTGAAGGKHIVRGNTVNGAWGICGEYLCYGTTANPVLVENNIFKNASLLEDGLWCNSAWQQQGSRAIFRRNRIYNSIGAGVQFYSNSNYHSMYNRFYHNIIYNSGYGGPYTRAPYELQEDAAATMTDIIVKNSIHYLIGNAAYATYAGTASASDITFTNNTWNATNPTFVNAPDDFTLIVGSPAIDAGGWLTTITSGTGSGTSFVVADSKYFCDGFDIAGVSGDEIQLEGKTTTVRVTDVNYTTNTITVASSVSWTVGDGVAIGLTG